MSELESGLKWAKFAFGDQVKDIKRIIVVPKAVEQAGENGIILTGN